MACDALHLSPPSPLYHHNHRNPRTRRRHRVDRRLAAFSSQVSILFLVFATAAVALADQPDNATMAPSSTPATTSSDPDLLNATANNNTAALLSSSDLSALFYLHYNSGVIIPPLSTHATLLPTDVATRLVPFGLKFHQLDGFLQRALLWDAGYIYSPVPADTTNTMRRRLANNNSTTTTPTSARSPFLKIYTRNGIDMANISPTRSEMETAGCSLQLCSSESFGSTWRATECVDALAILNTVHCAIDPGDALDSIATIPEDGQQRSVWTAWNSENQDTVELPDKTNLASPEVNVAMSDLPDETSRDAGSLFPDGTFRLYTIHTVPFEDEPAVGQCPSSNTDTRGDLLPRLTIPCAPYNAVASSASTFASPLDGSTTTGSISGNPWKRPTSSKLVTTWLKSVAPKPTRSPIVGGNGKPTNPTNPPTSNTNDNNNIPSDALPGNNSKNSNGSGFDLLSLVPIVLGVLVAIALAMGFVTLRRRGAHKRSTASQGGGGDLDCTTGPYARSSHMKTDDGYLDGAAYLSPTPADGKGYYPSGHSHHDLAFDEEALAYSFTGTGTGTGHDSIQQLDPENGQAGVARGRGSSSERRRRSLSKALAMVSLRRGSSEPSSATSAISRPSLDTDHLKLLQTDPNLSASRVNYDKIVFERVISRHARYEVWLCQYEGEEIAVKKLAPPLPAAAPVPVPVAAAPRTNGGNSDPTLTDLDQPMGVVGGNSNLVEAFVSEIQLTASLEHPNLARFIGVAWARLPADSLCLVMEYETNGDLQKYLHRHKSELTWPFQKRKWASEVAMAVHYLHSQEPMVVHLELNSSHVVLSDRLQAKVIDFGERLSAEDWTQLRISGENPLIQQHLEFPYWAAPEVLRGEGGGGHGSSAAASDVYSFGMLLVEMDACRVPYLDAKNTSNGNPLKPFQLMNMVSTGRLKPTMTQSCPVAIQELVGKCTDAIPARRPTMREVIRMLEQSEFQ